MLHNMRDIKLKTHNQRVIPNITNSLRFNSLLRENDIINKVNIHIDHNVNVDLV
ncbi:MAG: hypothetical protein HeimC2_27650 [Candidatus Heimdallarchaeota archaeon LC_2]|nr:MAG: hypothetical protein HeimC2_27650 [Candidatus Heimdallarchaeota archaeon LC_2]